MTTENALASENAETTAPVTAEVEDKTVNLQAPKEQDTKPEETTASGETGDEAAEKAEEGDKPRKKGVPASERIKQLTDQRNERDKRITDLEKRLARYEAKAPDPDKFNTDADYQRAVTEHTAKTLRRADIEEDIKEAREEVANDRREAWQARASEFAQSVQDFEQVAYTAPISDTVSELLMDSDFGPQIAYALGKDPAKAREISAMTPHKAALTIGRMEAEMAPKPKKISNAPPPVTTVGSSSRSSDPDPEKMSMAEYVKWRQQGGGG